MTAAHTSRTTFPTAYMYATKSNELLLDAVEVVASP
jgi:hypothetical protein